MAWRDVMGLLPFGRDIPFPLLICFSALPVTRHCAMSGSFARLSYGSLTDRAGDLRDCSPVAGIRAVAPHVREVGGFHSGLVVRVVRMRRTKRGMPYLAMLGAFSLHVPRCIRVPIRWCAETFFPLLDEDIAEPFGADNLVVTAVRDLHFSVPPTHFCVSAPSDYGAIIREVYYVGARPH